MDRWLTDRERMRAYRTLRSASSSSDPAASIDRALEMVDAGQISRALRMLHSAGVAGVDASVLAQLRAKHVDRQSRGRPGGDSRQLCSFPFTSLTPFGASHRVAELARLVAVMSTGLLSPRVGGGFALDLGWFCIIALKYRIPLYFSVSQCISYSISGC